ncbi:MAG: membrane protein insertase YidC [Melioribacteraceae bacterium]|nr:membrane protein insertase YidC [Melioribacteraceae bacterium]
MDKQTTAAFVLIGIILVVWLYFNAPEPQPQTATTPDTTSIINKQQSESVLSDESEQEVNNEILTPEVIIPEQVITIDNNLFKAELTSSGGRIRKFYLKNYATWYHRDIPDDNFYDKHVQLVNPTEGGDFNLLFVTKSGQLINTKNLPFTASLSGNQYEISENDSLTLKYTYSLGEEREIIKSYTFYGDKYSAAVDIELINLDDIVSSYTYDLMWENGINFVEQNSVDEANYSNASAFSGGEQVIVDATSEGEKLTKDISGSVDWIGVKNKYFGIIIAPEKPNSDGGAYFEGTHVNTKYGAREYYSATLKIPFKNQKHQKDSFLLYIGPMDYSLLHSYNRNFDAMYDFGSIFGLQLLRPISEYIILPLFLFLHNFIPNYGFVIIVFTIIIKIALYPLTKQSYKSMKRMSMLQPKIKELKEKYPDDQQKVQKETMKLYSTYGINPAGGCLPMLLQMPILFALFTFFNVTIEIREEPFILWITNLSSPDIIATLPFTIPLFGVDKISGLALLLGITMFLQQKMSIKDPSQKALVYIMPVMFTVLFMSFPSGLNLYYFMFNLFSIAQQYYINNHKTDEELVPVKDPKKKGGGFMARMMEAAEKQQKLQKEATRQSKKKTKKF